MLRFRNDSGELVFANSHKGRFASEKWLQANGEEARIQGGGKAGRVDMRCPLLPHQIKAKCLAILWMAREMYPSCVGLDIIVAAYPLRGACKSVPTRIDRFDVWRMGAHAIAMEGNNLRITTARGLSGNRPWVVIPEPRKKTNLSPLTRRFDTFTFAPSGSISWRNEFSNEKVRYHGTPPGDRCCR